MALDVDERLFDERVAALSRERCFVVFALPADRLPERSTRPSLVDVR